MLAGTLKSHKAPTSKVFLRSLCSLRPGKQSYLSTQNLKRGSWFDDVILPLQQRGFHAALGCVNTNAKSPELNLTAPTKNEPFEAWHILGLYRSSSPLFIPISLKSCCHAVDGVARFSTAQYPKHQLWNGQTKTSPFAIQSSSFSSRGKRGGNKNKKGNDGRTDLLNEKLISVLLKNPNARVDEVQVRLVIDQGQGQPSQIDVVSLSAAINKSSELGVDLVGINIKQDPPVIKAVDVSKLIYAKNKKSQGSSGGGGSASGGSGTKQTKTYKFKAGIHENDLHRKAENVIKYLGKGHPIQITITSNNFQLRADADAVISTLDRVREIVGDHAVEAHNVRKNAQGSFATIVFQPNKKRNSKGK